MNFISVDPGINQSGVALFVDNEYKQSWFFKIKSKGNERCSELYAYVHETISHETILHEIIENTYEHEKTYPTVDTMIVEDNLKSLWGRKNLDGIITLARAQTIFYIIAGMVGMKIETVHPSTWKNELFGKANADKEYVNKMCVMREGMLFRKIAQYTKQGNIKNQDELDAVCIGLWFAERNKKV